jgi:hypothetical protein
LTLEYPVVIDTVPPLVGLLSVDHVVVKGGSEVTVYRASTDVVQTGVAVGGYFFPGHTGAFEDENTYVAFFSYPYDLGSVEPIFITAEDRAGNMVKKSLPVLVKPVHNDEGPGGPYVREHGGNGRPSNGFFNR